MNIQNGKKPVSNLSSALASISISQNSQQQNQQQNQNQFHSSQFQHHNDFTDVNGRYSNEGISRNSQFHNQAMPPSLDVAMSSVRSQNDLSSNLPLDRIAEYRKNPPTEGISLFSHRVSFYLCIILDYLTILTSEIVSTKWIQSSSSFSRTWYQIQNIFS